MVNAFLSIHTKKKGASKCNLPLTFNTAWPAVTRLQPVGGSACHLTADSKHSAFVFTNFTPLTEGASLAPFDMEGSDPELELHAVRVLQKGHRYGYGSKASLWIVLFYYRSVCMQWHIIAFGAVTDRASRLTHIYCKCRSV